MRILVKTYRILSLGALLTCLGAGGATAEATHERELERWVPAFSLVTGVNAQRAQGTLGTSDVSGPQHTNPNRVEPRILPDAPVTARDRIMTPFFGGSIEIMTPAWVSLPGRPRAYSHADLSYAFGPTYNIPKTGNPGPFTRAGSAGITEQTIVGQGGYSRATVQPLVVTAGAGVAFTLRAWDRTLRIKPSLEYLREEIEVEGLVRRAVTWTDPPPFPRTVEEPYFRHVTLAAKGTKVYHGLGPGLELELDTYRAGPFMLSLYLSAKAWAFVNNEKQVIVATNEWGEHAVFEFLKNRWAFGGNLGLRFRWVPE